jgi:AcrR family transcriptional regulator
MNEAAMLFGRIGFDASSLSDLSLETGISKAGIYHYFKTKQDVYDAIILKALQELFEHVSAAVESADKPQEKLSAFMTAHADFFERNYWAFRCMLVSYTSMAAPEPLHEAVTLRENYEHMLRGIVAEGIRVGEFRDVDPAATGRAVLSMLNWMARWFQPSGPKPARAFAQEYFEVLFTGLQR